MHARIRSKPRICEIRGYVHMAVKIGIRLPSLDRLEIANHHSRAFETLRHIAIRHLCHTKKALTAVW